MKWTLALVLLLSCFSFGQASLGTGNPVVTNGLGQPIPGATVAICATNPGSPSSGACSGSSLVTTYTDVTAAHACIGSAQPLNNSSAPTVGSGCSNPGTVDGLGNVVVYAGAGQYWCEEYGGGIVGISVTPCIFPVTVSGLLGGNNTFTGTTTLYKARFSTPTIINVQVNSYGFSLVADGVTDNCSAFNSLMAAVPAYSTLYFPFAASIYHFSPSCSSNNGIVVTKDGIQFLGDVPGWYDGTTMHGSVVDVPITFNTHTGSARNMATDCRVMGATAACAGVSSGAAGTTGGGIVVENHACVGSGNTNPDHCVLIQSGPHNRATGIRSWNYFHCIAIRSSQTYAEGECNDSNDAIVKSITGSGNVDDVELHVRMKSSNPATYEGSVHVEADGGAGVYTHGVTVYSIHENTNYGPVIQATAGGVIDTVKFYSTCRDGVNCAIVSNVAGTAGTMTNLEFNVDAYGISGQCFNNGAAATLTSISGNCSTSGTPTAPGNSFFQRRMSGVLLWDQNAASASIFSDLSDNTTAKWGSEVLQSGTNFWKGFWQFGATEGVSGLPGFGFYFNTAAAGRGLESVSKQASLDQNGRFASNKVVVTHIAGENGVLVNAPTTDAGNPCFQAFDSTASAIKATVQCNGNALFPYVQFGVGTASSSISQVQQQRGVAGCTTAASVGGICGTDITVTWTAAFADANYQVSCTANGAPTNVPGVPYVVAATKLAGTVHINYMAYTAAAASWASIDCTAIHP